MILQLKLNGKQPAAKSLALAEPVDAIRPDRESQTDRARVTKTFETAPLSRPRATLPATSHGVSSGSPRIKTYTAASLPKAMDLARRELGEDAILIQSKKIDQPSDPSQQYEVTFGVIPANSDIIDRRDKSTPSLERPVSANRSTRQRESKARAQKSPRNGSLPTIPDLQPVQPGSKVEGAGPGNTELSAQMDGLRRELLLLQSMILRSSLSKGAGSDANQSMPSVYSVLVRNDVDPDLVADLQRAVDERPRTSGELPQGDAKAMLADHLRSLLRTDQTLGGTETLSKPVVLVGAPGAGKTTAMMKLAVEFGIKRGRDVEILSLHRGRPEANPALETMTGLLDIRCQIIGSLETFKSALARPRPAGTLVLVDTIGYGAGSIDDDRNFASMVDSEQSAEVHLVLPAAWHPASLRHTVDRFEIFHPTRLLFTMVDQAAVFGPMIEEALRTGKALSFANGGPAGSGGLRAVSLDWVLQQMWDVSKDSSR